MTIWGSGVGGRDWGIGHWESGLLGAGLCEVLGDKQLTQREFFREGVDLRNVLGGQHLRRENRLGDRIWRDVFMGGAPGVNGCRERSCGEKLPKLPAQKLPNNSNLLI